LLEAFPCLCSEVKERMKKTKAEKAATKAAASKAAPGGKAAKNVPRSNPKGGKR
jgi:hypothetical protein